MVDNKPETWEEVFSANRDNYERFETLLRELIESLIKKEGVPAQIASRTKSVQSFKEKVERKNKEGRPYDDPINQITDVVGIRIITYYLRGVDIIGNLIKREFEVDEKNSLEGFDLVSVNSSLNSRVNIFNPYSRSWT